MHKLVSVLWCSLCVQKIPLLITYLLLILIHVVECIEGSIFLTSYLTAVKVRKTAKIRSRYNQVPHLTQDTSLDKGKDTRNIPYKKYRYKTVWPFPSRWPQGCNDQTRQITKMIHKRSTALERSVQKNLTEGLKLVSWYKLSPHFWCWLRQIDVWLAWKIPTLSMYYVIKIIQKLWNNLLAER